MRGGGTDLVELRKLTVELVDELWPNPAGLPILYCFIVVADFDFFRGLSVSRTVVNRSVNEGQLPTE